MQVINRFSICFLAANGKIIYNHNVAWGVETQGSKMSDKVLAIINPKGYCTVTIRLDKSELYTNGSFIITCIYIRTMVHK